MGSIRKYGLVILVMLALSGVATAQTDSVQTAKTKISYYHTIGVDYVLCPGAIEYQNQKFCDMGVRLHVLNGIQFNPWLMLSLDFQFAYTHCHGEDWGISLPMKALSNGSKDSFWHFENLGFKLGVDFRYRLLNRFKWSPIIGITGGPSIELTSYLKEDGHSKYWGLGGYFSEYSGCSYRYRNNKHLWFGYGWGVDFGYGDNLFGIEVLLLFKFEIQL